MSCNDTHLNVKPNLYFYWHAEERRNQGVSAVLLSIQWVKCPSVSIAPEHAVFERVPNESLWDTLKTLTWSLISFIIFFSGKWWLLLVGLPGPNRLPTQTWRSGLQTVLRSACDRSCRPNRRQWIPSRIQLLDSFQYIFPPPPNPTTPPLCSHRRRV